MDSGRSGGIFALLVLGLAAGWGYTFLASRLGVAFAIPVGVVGALSAAIILRGPLGDALARRLGLRDAPPDEITGQGLGELEERMDFSERLLAAVPKASSREQSRL